MIKSIELKTKKIIIIHSIETDFIVACKQILIKNVLQMLVL